MGSGYTMQDTLLPHCLKQLQGNLGLLALLVSADQSSESDHVGHHALLQHCLEHFQGLLGLLALRASADQSIVGDYVGRKALLQNCLEHLQSLSGITGTSLPFRHNQKKINGVSPKILRR